MASNGLMGHMGSSDKKEERKITRAEAGKKIEAQKERDHEMVTGIFKYIERKGGVLRFRFKKYPHDDFQAYELWDGVKYSLPRMVVRHLNNNVHYLEYKRLQGLEGDMQQGALNGHMETNMAAKMTAVQKVPRCEFRSLEFMDDDIEPSQLVEVKLSA